MEEQSTHENSQRLVTPAPCCLEIGELARALGLTCQDLFMDAFAFAEGGTDTLGRALFARYIIAPAGERMLTPGMARYLDKERAKLNGHQSPRQTGFCAACMLTREGILGLAYAYSLIYPEAAIVRDDRSVPAGRQVDREMAERIWKDLHTNNHTDTAAHELDRLDDQINASYDD